MKRRVSSVNVPETDVYLLYEFAVYPRRNVIVGPVETYQIEPKVMDVLSVLMAQRGDVLSREELIAAVWTDSVGGDERLTRAISQLRKAFLDSVKSPRFIETVPKRGYRLVCPVAVEPRGQNLKNGENISLDYLAPGPGVDFDRRAAIVVAGLAVGVLIILVAAGFALS